LSLLLETCQSEGKHITQINAHAMLFVQAMYSMQLLFDLHIPCHRLIYMFETGYEMSML